MKIVVADAKDISQAECDSLVVLAFEQAEGEGTELSGSVLTLDKASDGYFSAALASETLSSKLGKVSSFFRVPGIAAEQVIVVGAGPLDKFDQGAAMRCAGAAAKRIAEKACDRAVFDFGHHTTEVAAAAVAGAMNGCVGQDIFRAKKNLFPIAQIAWLSFESVALERGEILGEAMLLTRDLVNLPASHMYPETFTKRAAAIAVSSGLELEVWDEMRLRREGCGALLGVAAGSSRPPRLLIMRYRGTKSQPPLALVGKGVTFDSGGLSLKPSDSMITMKCDMAGAATVLGAMQAIARLKLATPVVGLVGLVENMISGSAFKLGDVLTARSGKTIEIHNTDAEGRLVLADVLNVALDQNPSSIVDLATLTGACVVALGMDIAGLMGNDAELQTRMQQAAEAAGELVWPLPMQEFFSDQIKSKVADIKNMGDGRWGGATTAAKFLQEFVGETPWLHIDIAGPAFADSPKPHIDAGASGALVRSLVALAEQL